MLRKTLFALACVAFLSSPLLAQNQSEQIKADFLKIKTDHDPKHTPKITAPDKVNAGDWFDVTIEIGEGARHPSLVDHHVIWIALQKDGVELARAYLNPVMASPKVTFTVALTESGNLEAVEMPTHTAPWISTKKIEVTPAPAAAPAAGDKGGEKAGAKAPAKATPSK